ncbi:MAG: hypothetical protein M3357_04835 [Actinomycetota bacterium]|nr:hypothetical protein [Actinomycetota bacterium]
MARPRSRRRAFVLTAGVVGGLIIGLLVIATVDGTRQAATYRPFFAGMKDHRVENIREGGPVLIPDPRGGQRTFYLDLEGDEIIALHVVPPGGNARCPVQFDHQQQRYEDCKGAPVDRETLRRFQVFTRAEDDEGEAIFVDLRELMPPVTPRS